MATYDLPQCLLKGRSIKGATEADGLGHGVGSMLAIQLVEEPEALLGVGEGQGLATVGEEDRGKLEWSLLLAKGIDLRGQPGDGRLLEEGME